MRDYEYLPPGERKLAEQLDEEEFKRRERERELEAVKGELLEVFGWIEGVKSLAERYDQEKILVKINEIDDSLCNIEESILEVLNKYN